MNKLLINTPDGTQKIIEIEDTGSTQATVLWDERSDGKMDELMLDRVGGFRKLNGVLVFDQALRDSHDAKKDESRQKETKAKERNLRLKDIDKVSDLEELKPLLKDLVEYLGL